MITWFRQRCRNVAAKQTLMHAGKPAAGGPRSKKNTQRVGGARGSPSLLVSDGAPLHRHMHFLLIHYLEHVKKHVRL